jgi:hypothetical protein
MPYPNVVPGTVPPAPGGSSKRAADALESRIITDWVERGQDDAPPPYTPGKMGMAYHTAPSPQPGGLTGKNKAAIAAGGLALGGATALGAYAIHEHNEAHQ